jgi:surface antigen
MNNFTLPALALAGVLAFPVASSADPWKDESGHRGGPPPWAPAHGYRRKHHEHEHEHREYREEYREPVAEVRVSKEPSVVIRDGKCNREAVGAVLGGIVGGVIGNQVGRNNGNTEVGTVAGAIIGVVVGKNIGRDMDNRDAGCAAHALNQARDGQTVTWRNPDTGLDFHLTPTETFHRDGLLCRRYRTETARGGERAEGQSEACRTPDGNWTFGEHTRI